VRLAYARYRGGVDTQIARNTAPVVPLGTVLVNPEYVEQFLSGFQ
jgi:hypothetical protein